MKNFYFIFIVGLLFLCFKCENEGLTSQETTPFTLDKPYFQKVIPGQRNQPIYYKVGFTLNNMQDAYSLDSILWDSMILKDFKSIEDKIIFKSVKSELLRVQELPDNLKRTDMLVFYSKKSDQYFHQYGNIEELESLILP